jgi:hypothetical protein
VAAQNAERQVHVGIIAAADLAAMLNELPHLRSAFIATGAFRSWGESWEALHQRVIAFRRRRGLSIDGTHEKLALYFSSIYSIKNALVGAATGALLRRGWSGCKLRREFTRTVREAEVVAGSP